MYSSDRTIIAGFHWTLSSLSMSFLGSAAKLGGAPDTASLATRGEEEPFPWALGYCPSQYSPAGCWPLSLQGHTADSCSPYCPPGPPGAFLKSLSLASQSPVCADNGYFLSQVPGLLFVFLNFMRLPSAHFSSLLGSPALQCINCSPQHGVVSELAEGALHPIIQGIN